MLSSSLLDVNSVAHREHGVVRKPWCSAAEVAAIIFSWEKA